MHKREALQILGLTETSSVEEIKKSYRKLAMQTHPDKNPDNRDSEEKFKRIAEAYACLTDPAYNSTQESRGGFNTSSRSFNAEDMFREFGFDPFFGRRNTKASEKSNPASRAIKLPDVDIGGITVDLETVLFKETHTLNLKVQAVCSCLRDPNLWVKCDTCKGLGVIVQRFNSPVGVVQNTGPCFVCRGEGWRSKRTCPKCKDSRVTHKDKKVKLDFAKVVELGRRIRVPRAGNEGLNVPPSDLYLTLSLRMPNIDKLDSNDIQKLRELLGKA
jgi:molecular chaperone DnaJ